MSKIYYKTLCSSLGRPAKDARIMIGAVIAKHKLSVLDEETVEPGRKKKSAKAIDDDNAVLQSNRPQKKKPRTYREIAESLPQRGQAETTMQQKTPCRYQAAIAVVSQRNLNHIAEMLTEYPLGTPIPLPYWLLRRYWILPHLHQQQDEMYKTNTRRCDDCIVSISQPYLRPIIRGKQGKTVEFGAKISLSLTGRGLAHVDKLH